MNDRFNNLDVDVIEPLFFDGICLMFLVDFEPALQTLQIVA